MVRSRSCVLLYDDVQSVCLQQVIGSLIRLFLNLRRMRGSSVVLCELLESTSLPLTWCTCC